MKKRLSALLCCALLLTGSVFAAGSSMDNFKRSKTYADNFSDVSDNSTFHDDIVALYEYGLTIGRSNGTFGVKDHVTIGGVLIFAARIHSLYQYGNAETGPASYQDQGTSSSTYAPYVAYLTGEDVIQEDFSSSYSQAATRAQVAGILSGCLPDSVLTPTWADMVNGAYATGKYIPDVTTSTAYQQSILKLYQCGISHGSNSKGSYFPNATISRGALTAMLARMIDPSLRVTPDCSAAWSAAETSWRDLITGNSTYTAAPTTMAQVQSDVNYMLKKESSALSLHYGKPTTSAFANKVMGEALTAVKAECEQLYNFVNCSYQLSSGEIRLYFSAVGCSSANLKTYRAYTLAQAISVHDQLWKNGQITFGMTDYEKARVYYTWICQNCRYDYGASESSLSHIAYSLFKNKLAVCDGYTGAYNLLLKLEGIRCDAINNDSHIWTVADLDGTTYHIDTTWGDSTDNKVDYSYFAMTPQQSWNVHPW